MFMRPSDATPRQALSLFHKSGSSTGRNTSRIEVAAAWIAFVAVLCKNNMPQTKLCYRTAGNDRQSAPK